MRRWAPWAAAFVAWSLTFDYQVRAAGDRFVAEQLARSQRGEAVALIRDAYRPRIRRAALLAWGPALLAGVGGMICLRRRTSNASGSTLES